MHARSETSELGLFTEARVSARAWLVPAALASFVVVGAALRLPRLDGLLRFDDTYTVAVSHRPFLDMLGVFRFEANGMLYELLMWPLLRISESEALVRAPALLAGLATIPAVYWVGRRLVGRDAALIGAALAALSPALIRWSTVGRGYPLAILFATLSFGCLLRALDRPERRGRWQVLYVLAILATAYSSTVALAILPVQAVVLATRRMLRAWLRPALAIAVGLVPVLILTYVESTYRDPLHWLWRPDFQLVRRVAGELAAGHAYTTGVGSGYAAVIGLSVLALVLAGVVACRPRVRMPDWGTRVVLAWALFPPVFLFAVSQVRPFFWDRYLVVVLPALALLVGVLLRRLPRVLGVAFGAIVASLLLAASVTSPPPNTDYQGYAAWLEARRQPRDPLVVYPVEQLTAISYYAHSLRVDGLIPAEEWNDTPLPPNLYGYRRPVDWGESPLGPPTAADLKHLASRTGSVFMLSYPVLLVDVPLAWAEKRGCVVEKTEFGAVTGIAVTSCG